MVVTSTNGITVDIYQNIQDETMLPSWCEVDIHLANLLTAAKNERHVEKNTKPTLGV